MRHNAVNEQTVSYHRYLSSDKVLSVKKGILNNCMLSLYSLEMPDDLASMGTDLY